MSSRAGRFRSALHQALKEGRATHRRDSTYGPRGDVSADGTARERDTTPA